VTVAQQAELAHLYADTQHALATGDEESLVRAAVVALDAVVDAVMYTLPS